MSDITYWFDLDGTLVRFDRPFARLLEETLGPDLDEAVHETFRRRLFVAFDSFEDDPYRLGFEAIADEHGLSIDPVDRAEAFRTFELRATEPVDGAHVAVERCARLGSVGILTNGEGRMQRAKLEEHDLLARVDEVVISNEVGVRKPDPGIFELAAERLPASTQVYVGDTYEEDVTPALNAGFVPVHVRNDDGPPVSLATAGSIARLLGAPVEGH